MGILILTLKQKMPMMNPYGMPPSRNFSEVSTSYLKNDSPPKNFGEYCYRLWQRFTHYCWRVYKFGRSSLWTMSTAMILLMLPYFIRHDRRRVRNDRNEEYEARNYVNNYIFSFV